MDFLCVTVLAWEDLTINYMRCGVDGMMCFRDSSLTIIMVFLPRKELSSQLDDGIQSV